MFTISLGLYAAPVEKAFVIVLARDVEGAQFWSALDEALAPRLKAMQAGGEGEKALASFGEVFKNRALKKNTGLFLTFKKEDTLQVWYNIHTCYTSTCLSCV